MDRRRFTTRRRSVVVVLLAVLCAAGLPPHAGEAKQRRDACKRFEAFTIFKKGRVRVLELELQRDDEVVGHRYVSCWAPTGKRRRLFQASGRSDQDFFVSGPWLAWQRQILDADWHGVLSSRNVKTGARGPRYESSSTLASLRDGQIASYVGDSSRPWLVVAANGWFAWGVESRPESPGGTSIPAAVYAPDGRGGSVRLDAGVITRLSARGTSVCWRNDGRRRSAALPPDGA